MAGWSRETRYFAVVAAEECFEVEEASLENIVALLPIQGENCSNIPMRLRLASISLY